MWGRVHRAQRQRGAHNDITLIANSTFQIKLNSCIMLNYVKNEKIENKLENRCPEMVGPVGSDSITPNPGRALLLFPKVNMSLT